eukprot:scaffold79917_cov53-Phaeocystis_antarctica.AAC.1
MCSLSRSSSATSASPRDERRRKADAARSTVRAGRDISAPNSTNTGGVRLRTPDQRMRNFDIMLPSHARLQNKMSNQPGRAPASIDPTPTPH